MAPRDVLAAALKLPTAERAQLVSALARRLDDDGEDRAAIERAWAVEIERRAKRALRGDSRGKDWEASVRAIRAKHRAR